MLIMFKLYKMFKLNKLNNKLKTNLIVYETKFIFNRNWISNFSELLFPPVIHAYKPNIKKFNTIEKWIYNIIIAPKSGRTIVIESITLAFLIISLPFLAPISMLFVGINLLLATLLFSHATYNIFYAQNTFKSFNKNYTNCVFDLSKSKLSIPKSEWKTLKEKYPLVYYNEMYDYDTIMDLLIKINEILNQYPTLELSKTIDELNIFKPEYSQLRNNWIADTNSTIDNYQIPYSKYIFENLEIARNRSTNNYKDFQMEFNTFSKKLPKILWKFLITGNEEGLSLFLNSKMYLEILLASLQTATMDSDKDTLESTYMVEKYLEGTIENKEKLVLPMKNLILNANKINDKKYGSKYTIGQEEIEVYDEKKVKLEALYSLL